MSKTSTGIALVLITTMNLAVVGLSSLFAIYGDGSAGGMYWVLGIGSLWVLGFAGRATCLANRGEERAAIGIAAKTLPYALLALLIGQIAWVIVGSLL